MPAKNQFKRTKEELLAELRRVAGKVKRPTVTIVVFKQHSKFAISCYKRRFGTWNRALAEAGLQTGLVTRRNPIDPAEALCRLATHQPKQGQRARGKGKGKKKATGNPPKAGKGATGKRRGQSTDCADCADCTDEANSLSEIRDLLSDIPTHQPKQGQRARGKGKGKGKGKKKATGKPCRLGKPLNFRGILYEPQSEHAVIHLFGTVSEEMGYRMEKIQHAYPDGIALRKVPGGRGAWERVRVEFELRSSNFRLHKHDPAYCDAIICWEHDWEDCPLEVVELKRVVEALAAETRRRREKTTGTESDI